MFKRVNQKEDLKVPQLPIQQPIINLIIMKDRYTIDNQEKRFDADNFFKNLKDGFKTGYAEKFINISE
ncbi:hypothetical protein pb186bvf_018408 [Paramecium bursaria]